MKYHAVSIYCRYTAHLGYDRLSFVGSRKPDTAGEYVNFGETLAKTEDFGMLADRH
jgi:hypothetical protein